MKVIGCDERIEQKKAIKEFGEFIEADSIHYKDFGKSELYIIEKGNRKFKIKTGWGLHDGSWLNFEEIAINFLED